MDHYYHDGQTQYGPMDRDAFKSLVGDGVIADDTLVYREDLEEWLSFFDFKQFVKANKKSNKFSASSAGEARSARRRQAERERVREEIEEGDSGSVMGGILMMIGAVVWFVVGLSAGYIYFYPPILFIFGLISTIKGALNR